MTIKQFLLSLALGTSTLALAQSRPLPFLGLNTDVRSIGMGQVSMGQSQGMFLYTNPAAFFEQDKRFSADVSASGFFFPKGVDGAISSSFYSASLGYRLAPSHAIFVGFRYFDEDAVTGYDVIGNPTKEYNPFCWSIDAGYAFRFHRHWTAFASGSFIYSHLSHNARTFGVTLGANYHQSMRLGERPAQLSLTAKVADLGPQIDYGNKYKASMPANVALGGELSTDLTTVHRLGIGAQMRYFFQPSASKALEAGVGAEYTYKSKYSARVGYQYADLHNSHVTMGLGAKFADFRVNVSYAIATDNLASNSLSLGLGYNF